jgi:putative ABC transport system permease protein
MLRSYFLVSWRNLLRSKTFSVINIAGLAIGMMVVLHIYRFVTAEQSYDAFHKDADRIFRVPLAYTENGKIVRTSAANCPAVGPMLKEDFPEVEYFSRLAKSEIASPSLTVSYTNPAGQSVAFNEFNFYYADEGFFSVFGFPFIEGDPLTCLQKPGSIVLTERMMKKYFAAEPALGKTIRLNQSAYIVTGVMKDVPENSHLQFDAISSFSTIGEKFRYDDWGWPAFYTYVKLAPSVDKTDLEKKFPAFVRKYVGNQENDESRYAVDLQPITEIHLQSDLSIEQSVNGSARTIRFISLLGIFILAIAWINYINLSTAKAIERAKEVGLRKVSGASRRQLVIQFIFDACLINVMALGLAIVFLTATAPAFELLTGKHITAILFTSGVVYTFSFWFWIVATVVTGILVVGLYPALLLSSFNPTLVLKGKFTKSKSGTTLRKSLVGFQYIVSIFLIAGTVAVSRQIDFMQSQDPGYNKDQVLVMRGPSVYDSTFSAQMNFFRNELKSIPAVEKFSANSAIPGHLLPYPNSMRRADQPEDKNTGYYPVGIDDNFFATYEMPLVAGRNFAPNERFYTRSLPQMTLMTFFQAPSVGAHEGSDKIIINEKLCQRLGFKTPQEAIHERVKFRTWEEFEGEIIGVVKNYHQLSLKDNYSAIGYFYPSFEQWGFLSARINGHDLPGTIEKLRKSYASAFPGNAFEYFFLDDYVNNQYKDDQQFKQIFTVLTALAIVIACLGLLGLALFSVSQRLKEIGIRKVLGASVSSVLILFSKDSLRLLVISYVVTLPFIWFAVDSWLNNFAFHIGMEWIIFWVPPVCLLVVSLSTVVVITLKTALMSPVISLRSE